MSNKFEHLKYRCVKITEEGAVCIMSAHSDIDTCIYDYETLRKRNRKHGVGCRIDIEHCVGYDEDGLGVWESYKGGSVNVPDNF